MENNIQQATKITRIAQNLALIAGYLGTVEIADNDTKECFLATDLSNLADVINNTSEELTEISDNLIKLEGEEFIKGDVK